MRRCRARPGWRSSMTGTACGCALETPRNPCQNTSLGEEFAQTPSGGLSIYENLVDLGNLGQQSCCIVPVRGRFGLVIPCFGIVMLVMLIDWLFVEPAAAGHTCSSKRRRAES